MIDTVSDGITSKAEYAPYLLEALHILGGETTEEVLLEKVGKMMEKILTKKDRSMLYRGSIPRWRNQALHMLEGLIEDRYIIRKGATLTLKHDLQPKKTCL